MDEVVTCRIVELVVNESPLTWVIACCGGGTVATLPGISHESHVKCLYGDPYNTLSKYSLGNYTKVSCFLFFCGNNQCQRKPIPD